VTAAQRPTFPTELDTLLLRVAVNQASTEVERLRVAEAKQYSTEADRLRHGLGAENDLYVRCEHDRADGESARSRRRPGQAISGSWRISSANEAPASAAAEA
jgi:hypothetical protein